MAGPLHNNDMRAVHAHPCDGSSVPRGTDFGLARLLDDPAVAPTRSDHGPLP